TERVVTKIFMDSNIDTTKENTVGWLTGSGFGSS
ncbi:MAG: hypothetical protein ACI9P8_001014, partial [Bacteroidia bacterium]